MGHEKIVIPVCIPFFSFIFARFFKKGNKSQFVYMMNKKAIMSNECNGGQQAKQKPGGLCWCLKQLNV